jgi:hypothetical protein
MQLIVFAIAENKSAAVAQATKSSNKPRKIPRGTSQQTETVRQVRLNGSGGGAEENKRHQQQHQQQQQQHLNNSHNMAASSDRRKEEDSSTGNDDADDNSASGQESVVCKSGVDWAEVWSIEHTKFFYAHFSGSSSWIKPKKGVIQCTDPKSNQPYYADLETGECSWVAPPRRLRNVDML